MAAKLYGFRFSVSVETPTPKLYGFRLVTDDDTRHVLAVLYRGPPDASRRMRHGKYFADGAVRFSKRRRY